MSKQLPPAFGPKLGPEHQAYNQDVSFVMNLDNNSPRMLWLVKNALDLDGRDTASNEMLVGGAQLFTNIVYLYDDIDGGDTLSLVLRIAIHPPCPTHRPRSRSSPPNSAASA